MNVCDREDRRHEAVSSNLYGLGDRYNAQDGHVVAALMMKIHAAKVTGNRTVQLWGSGTPKREILFSEDLADACVFFMKNYSSEMFLNVGMGCEMRILQIAEHIARIAGWTETFTFDRSKPDGMPCKVMDMSAIAALGLDGLHRFRSGNARGLSLVC